MAPATALYFAGYESGKRLLNPSNGIAGDMLVGCYAQALAGVAFTPIDIIKERMQASCASVPVPLDCVADVYQCFLPDDNGSHRLYSARLLKQQLQAVSQMADRFCLLENILGKQKLRQGPLAQSHLTPPARVW